MWFIQLSQKCNEVKRRMCNFEMYEMESLRLSAPLITPCLRPEQVRCFLVNVLLLLCMSETLNYGWAGIIRPQFDLRIHAVLLCLPLSNAGHVQPSLHTILFDLS